jgi:hypothetical protein
MSDFERKENARWRQCYHIVLDLKPGDVITYAEIEDRLGCTRQAAQAAMIEANLRLGRDGRNRCRVHTGIGWLVLTPGETVELIRSQNAKAARADNLTAERVNATQQRRKELTPEECAVVDHEQRVAAAKAALNGRRRHASRTLLDRLTGDKELPA